MPFMKLRFLLPVAAVFAAFTPLHAEPIAPAIQGDLVALTDRKLQPFDGASLAGKKYYAIYFSASWCGPCKRFTPELVDFYKKIKSKNADFELIFVSRDRSEKDMESYMVEDKMQWPALTFAKASARNALSSFAGAGIPCLVFVDAEGKVLSDSYVGSNYVGPTKVLEDIQRTLRKSGGSTSGTSKSSFDEIFKKKTQP